MRQLHAGGAADSGAFKGLFMNDTSRPVGPLVEFAKADWPSGRDLTGANVRLEKIDVARHGPALWAHVAGHDHVWDYLFEAPPQSEAEFLAGLSASVQNEEKVGYAIIPTHVDADQTPVGYAFYLNIAPDMGRIEVGNINFSPELQQTPAATEAMYLMMQEAFALGNRRYEWKCNALNMPSRRAAQRLGFSWEGIFRQHYIVKGLNRDTAWLAMTDGDWKDICRAFETWLAPDNFDSAGRQRVALRTLTAPFLAAKDPAQSP